MWNVKNKWHLAGFLFFSYYNDARSNKYPIHIVIVFDEVFVSLYLQYTTGYHTSECGKYFISIWKKI